MPVNWLIYNVLIPPEIALPLRFGLAAALYTSVGHAGASAYIAAMALVGTAPLAMRPTALILNIFVASLGVFRFHRAGLIDWRMSGLLALGAAPAATLGGAISLPPETYKPLLGLVLFAASVRLFWPKSITETGLTPPPDWLLTLTGAGIGLLSGLTGTGGGIFLSPLMIFLGWAAARQVSGIAIAFILVNSVFGLAGNLASIRYLPPDLPVSIAAVLAGALIGTVFGINRLPRDAILRVLGVVLLIASAKLVGIW